jgi:hypothetical protein
LPSLLFSVKALLRQEDIKKRDAAQVKSLVVRDAYPSTPRVAQSKSLFRVLLDSLVALPIAWRRSGFAPRPEGNAAMKDFLVQLMLNAVLRVSVTHKVRALHRAVFVMLCAVHVQALRLNAVLPTPFTREYARMQIPSVVRMELPAPVQTQSVVHRVRDFPMVFVPRPGASVAMEPIARLATYACHLAAAPLTAALQTERDVSASDEVQMYATLS